MSQPIHIHVHHEDGALWATVDEYPGVFGAGDDLAELHASLQEGIALVTERPVVLAAIELPETTTIAELQLAAA